MSDQLFDLAVQQIRRGTNYVDLIIELEGAAIAGTDVRDVINSATKYVEEMQTESFQACVDFFKRGGSYLDAVRKLIELKFSPFDAECVASRAQVKADAEMAEENFTALGGKPDGHES
ncbi:MAG TPA: hypothetical protein VLA42_11105 [Verrucomicrobiae bacterium]|jgi:hypothetical protein|nr:hypothetical protein [Verrucomicrobiae bacterium]